MTDALTKAAQAALEALEAVQLADAPITSLGVVENVKRARALCPPAIEALRAALAAQPDPAVLAREWLDREGFAVITRAERDAHLERHTGEPHVDGYPLFSGLPPAAQQPDPVAWCSLTPAGQIEYFDGKPMVMPGPVGNHIHPVPLYAAAQPQQAAPETIVGHSVERGGWCVFEQTGPGEYDCLSGPFATEDEAIAAQPHASP